MDEVIDLLAEIETTMHELEVIYTNQLEQAEATLDVIDEFGLQYADALALFHEFLEGGVDVGTRPACA